MTIIETDGENVQPLTVDSITIFVGQRYSFIVRSLPIYESYALTLTLQLNTNQPVGNYWIRAKPNSGNMGFAGGTNSAILRYSGAPITEPTTRATPNNTALLETDLHPLVPPGVVSEQPSLLFVVLTSTPAREAVPRGSGRQP